MTAAPPTLHMLCGKIAAGKSTLAAELGESASTVVIAEDVWLHALFADQMTSLADFMRCSALLRAIMGPHITALLNAGVSVVLDFQANTVESRAWMRGLVEATGAAHQMHVLMVPDAVCLARLRARNAAGDHPFAATEEQFHRVTSHLVLPTPDEGFEVVVHEGQG